MPYVSPQRIESVLRATPLLESLRDDEIATLARHVRVVHFEPGAQVWTKGALGTHAYFVLKGRIRLTVTARNGHELLLQMMEPGDICGEISAIERGPRSTNATAETATDALSLASRPLIAAIEGSPRSLMDLVRILCGHLREAVTNIEILGLHSAETRIWCRLSDLASRYPDVDPENGATRIKHGLSQQGLADSVGLTRVMVNRQMNEWREKGFIEFGRGVIEIYDPAAFEAYVWRVPG
jgi:CRP-like cAMP-binding protein